MVVSEAFTAAYEEFLNTPFPKCGSETEIIFDLFMDLVLFDSSIGGVLDAAYRIGKVNLSDLFYDQQLENSIIKQLNGFQTSDNDKLVLRTYLDYLYLIEAALTHLKSNAD